MFEFKDLDYLTDNEIDLKIEEKIPPIIEKGFAATYKYRITLHNSDETIGRINIRIDNNADQLYFVGHIGYQIEEFYRGRSYASKACQIIKQVAIAHRMTRLLITCNPDNFASRRTCEKLELRLVEIVDLPFDNEMYLGGDHQKCVYEWIIPQKQENHYIKY